MHEYDDLLGPGVKWMIERGVKARVGPYGRLDLPQPLKDATEKYAGQTRLSDDGTCPALDSHLLLSPGAISVCL